MADKRRKHAPGFKARVALDAVSEKMTAREIADQYELHINLVNSWKKQLKGEAKHIFEHNQRGTQKSKEPELYEQIGRLKMELEWLKKKVESVE